MGDGLTGSQDDRGNDGTGRSDRLIARLEFEEAGEAIHFRNSRPPSRDVPSPQDDQTLAGSDPAHTLPESGRVCVLEAMGSGRRGALSTGFV